MNVNTASNNELQNIAASIAVTCPGEIGVALGIHCPHCDTLIPASVRDHWSVCNGLAGPMTSVSAVSVNPFPLDTNLRVVRVSRRIKLNLLCKPYDRGKPRRY